MEKNVQSLKRMKKIIYPLIVIILIILILMTNKTSAPVIINKTGNFDILEEKDIVLIDVRSKEEYNEGHIEKAINIPYNELQDKIHYDLKTKIAVYCQTGSRSHLAALILNDMGYKTVYDLGGITKYQGKLVK